MVDKEWNVFLPLAEGWDDDVFVFSEFEEKKVGNSPLAVKTTQWVPESEDDSAKREMGCVESKSSDSSCFKCLCELLL